MMNLRPVLNGQLQSYVTHGVLTGIVPRASIRKLCCYRTFNQCRLSWDSRLAFHSFRRGTVARPIEKL